VRIAVTELNWTACVDIQNCEVPVQFIQSQRCERTLRWAVSVINKTSTVDDCIADFVSAYCRRCGWLRYDVAAVEFHTDRKLLRFCFCILLLSFLTISVSPVVSTSTGRIFTRFSPFSSAMAADERSEHRFSNFQGTLPQQPTFVC